MTILHSAITNADLHENKGVSAATNNFVATATAAATVWKLLTTSNMDTTSFFRINKEVLCYTFPDVSTASNIKFVIPVAATVNKVSTVLQGAIITADSVLTCTNHSGGSMGTITVAFTGSAAGDLDTLSPSSNNTFTAGQIMTITSDGGSANAVALLVCVELTQTA